MGTRRAQVVFERLATKHLPTLVFLLSVSAVALYAVAWQSKAIDMEKLATATDSVLKILAIIMGSAWAVNRYFVERVDVPQFRVEIETSLVPASAIDPKASGKTLLIYRLDLINTGKSVIRKYRQYLAIERVSIDEQAVVHDELHRWPELGLHLGGSAEPGSWSAVNDAIIIPQEVAVVRFYLETHLASGQVWTWHKTIDLGSCGDA